MGYLQSATRVYLIFTAALTSSEFFRIAERSLAYNNAFLNASQGVGSVCGADRARWYRWAEPCPNCSHPWLPERGSRAAWARQGRGSLDPGRRRRCSTNRRDIVERLHRRVRIRGSGWTPSLLRQYENRGSGASCSAMSAAVRPCLATHRQSGQQDEAAPANWPSGSASPPRARRCAWTSRAQTYDAAPDASLDYAGGWCQAVRSRGFGRASTPRSARADTASRPRQQARLGMRSPRGSGTRLIPAPTRARHPA